MNHRHSHAAIGTPIHGNSESRPEALRQTGLDAVGAVPWGTHFCQFYATAQDLVETLVPYFREGLAANEYCMWVTSAPLGVEDAKAALRAAVPGFDVYLARGQMEILDYSQWYTKNGSFDADAVLQAWAGKLVEARQRGFDGLRVTGNTFWLEEDIWQDFKHYEGRINGAIEGLPVLVLCAYSLEKCGLGEILQMAALHEFALVKQAGRWELIRSVEHQVELAARESRERLERFAEITFEGIYVSENGRIVDCNEQFAQMIGYTIEELKGMAIADLIAPEDRERVMENARLGRDSHVELTAIRKDGSRIFVEGRATSSPSRPALRYAAVRDITKHKCAEAILKESNDRLAALVEALPDAIFFKDGKSRWQVINQAAAHLFQVQDFPWQGKSEMELAAERPDYRAAHQACLDSDEAAWGVGGLSVSTEHVVGPDGARELEVHKVPLFEADGGRKGLVVVARDVTERKRVAMELSKSQEDLNRAQAVGRIGSWRLDIWRNELLWSDENHRIFGIPKGTPLTYETFLATVHPEDREYVDRVWKAALRGEPYDIEHRLVVDSQVKWVREKAELEFDQHGELVGGFGTTQDITDRKEVEAALKASEERFRAMVQAVPSHTFAADAEGVCTFVSESWCTYTGMSAEESSGLDWTDAVHSDDREAVAARWAEAMRTGTLFESKYRLRAADGSYRWFIDRALPALGAEGKVISWTGSVTDVDDLVHAQQALQDADRRKDEFLAMLAHELRNPLAPIRNAAHVLGRLGLEQPRIKWAQETIEGQVAHLTRLVDDLLDVSRIVRGKITLKKEAIELADLVERALEAARPLVESKGHRLIVRLPDGPVHLDVDPVRVTQVLLNLLDNAAKYNPDGGKIELDARVEDEEIEIRVKDDGMGIPADLLPHVFEMFQQGERTLDRSQGGLGIGLTLVQRLVGMHGGRVGAHSDGPGQGAAFTVRLPIKRAPSSSTVDNTPAQGQPTPGMRVLVVDDDPAVADSTAVLLEMEGYEVRIAANGFAALEQAPVFRPQAVLLDIGLEGLDGFETARRLRQLPEGRQLCLLAVTGYGDEETKATAVEAGCDHHLVKPVNISHLIGLLAEVAGASTS